MTRPSHAEYVAGCDEDQIANLITQARGRLETLQKSGWVKLWTVKINWANVAWFAENDYDAAIQWASGALVKEGKSATGKAGVGLEVGLERYRPEEVADLLARDKG